MDLYLHVSLCVVLCSLTLARAATVPLFSWGNTPALALAQRRISYQVEDHASVMERVLGKLAGAPDLPRSQSPDVVMVIVSKQLTTENLRKPAYQDAVRDFGERLDTANSASSHPYAMSQDLVSAYQLTEAVKSKFQNTQVLECGVDAACIASALQLRKEDEQLLLVTELPESRVSVYDGLPQELDAVSGAQRALEAAGTRYGMVYTGSARPQVPERRFLQALTQTNYTTCGPLCQTQVSWIQGMLVVTLGVVAITLGLSCMYVLDTPTRFQTPKEARDQ